MKKTIVLLMLSAMCLTSCATAKRNPELTPKELKEKKKENRQAAKTITLSAISISFSVWVAAFFIKQ